MMRRVAMMLALWAAPVLAQTVRTPIERATDLEPLNVTLEATTYRGRSAVRLQEVTERLERPNGHAVALVRGLELGDGTIEVDVAGVPGARAAADDRGFIGIAFHVQASDERFKLFYIRPTNGRADDQLRRNHATQYTAEPQWPWHRLRSEEPGKYESYADLEPGVWTALKIVVRGSRAELYVNGAEQPTLVVTEMKHPDRTGGIGLWIGRGTDGYFANLRVTPHR